MPRTFALSATSARSGLAASAMLALAFVLHGGVAAAQADAPVEDGDHRSLEAVHAEFLADDELQLEWPEADPVEIPDPPPDWLRSLANFLGGILEAIGPFLRILFYALCAIAVGSIAWFIGRNLLETRFPSLRRRQRPALEESVAEPYRPDAGAARSLLEEADALAAAGRFAEAVHLLLFRSIEDIQTRREGGVPRSLTAREIARLDALPDRARNGLSPIIQIVERSFFGGRDVDQDGWQAARASYERFAFGEAWA